ncbi:MAG TPA: leucyl/phenylalanyl-tRNA--protein transferase [Verrucomicrobiae bacterium]|nr:leucyl/phenylalanyl-tRNA--protein transferase [Verrucomicrobiae bacterium]
MLEAELLLNAYRSGIFPMAVGHRRDIAWFSPDPRAIIPLDHRFHVTHGLRRVWKRGEFAVTFDTDFESVIRECAKRKEGTWISSEIADSYCELHRLGHAHSLETRFEGKLVGGLYGVHIGAAFFGESMFHRTTDASKVALVALVDRLRANGFVLLDTQWQTPHLRQFGTYEIPRREYLQRLARAIAFDCKF